MRKVRLGIMGAGSMGTQVAAAALRSGRFEVVAVADSDPALVRALAQQLGATAHDHFQTLCTAGGLDAVYIGLPHDLHADACVAAAQADLHVLLDKPLCNSLAEADRIQHTAAASGRTWMVGFSYRFRAEWIRAASLITAGGIGAPYFVSDVIVEAYEHVPRWYSDESRGGGALQLQAHHSFDRLAWLLGTAPTEITGRVARPAGSADLAAHVMAVYPPDVGVAISVALGHGYDVRPRMVFVIQGDTGMLEIDDSRTLRHTTALGTTIESFAGDDWLERELNGFARAIDGTGTAFPGLSEGRAALECVLAARIASTTQGWVSVDE